MELDPKLTAYAVRALGKQMLSEQQLAQKIALKFPETSAETIDATVAWCRENRWIDDTAFAAEFVRFAGVRKGGRAMAIALKKRGIKSTTIEATLLNRNETAAAIAVARDKFPLIRATSALEKKAKLGRFLAGRGFSWDTISTAIEACGL